MREGLEEIRRRNEAAGKGQGRRSGWKALETPEYLEYVDRYRRAQELMEQGRVQRAAVLVERERPHRGLVGPWPSLSEAEVGRLGVERAERFYAGRYGR